MKTGITRIFLMALALGFALNLSAQQEENTEVVVVQKIIEDDGTQTIIKKRVYAGDDAETYLEENREDLSNMWEGNDEEGVEHFMIIRRDENGHRKVEVVIESDEMDIDIDEEQIHEEIQQHQKYEYHIRHSGSDNGAFMGVYPEENPLGEGVMLDGIVNHTGAQRAGLRTGDVLTAIDDHQLVRQSDLGQVLDLYEPGQVVTVQYLRDGQLQSAQLELTQRNNYARLERDPCQVFIGVSLGRQHAAEGKGISVSHVISETSAQTYGVQDGDVILRLDDVAVNTYDELLIERNRHQPGDWYTLTVLRNGQELDIDLQFMQCDEEEEVVPEVIEEVILEEVESTEEAPVVEPLQNLENNLELIEFKAFPNPTYGMLQVVFRAEAQPTVVRITDISGKVVYEESLQNFDGYYNREVNLRDVAPGALFLTIQQEGQIQSEKIILLPRA